MIIIKVLKTIFDFIYNFSKFTNTKNNVEKYIKIMEQNMKKNIKKINNKAFNEALKKIWKPGKFDPYGSYSGVCLDYERPVQDQDDL